MRKLRTFGAATATAALVLFGGVAAVRQQAPPRINVDSLATEFGLSADVKAQLAPQIDELNSLLARREQARAEHQQLWTRFQDVQASIAETLTPEQQARLWTEIGGSTGSGFGMGMGMGPMGAAGQGNPVGYGGHMGSGSHMASGGHMGYGNPMGRGGRMGYGSPMGHGGHMGYGNPMNNNGPGAGYMGPGGRMGPRAGNGTNGGGQAGS